MTTLREFTFPAPTPALARAPRTPAVNGTAPGAIAGQADPEPMAAPAVTKRCNQCGRQRTLADFAGNRTNRDGLQYYCRDCAAALHSRSYARKVAARLAADPGYRPRARRPVPAQDLSAEALLRKLQRLLGDYFAGKEGSS